MPKKKPIDFEINLTKMKWVPKHLREVPETISRAFETDITMEMIQPVIGTDHVKEWILKEDKDIPEFFNAPTMMQEWIAEKVIKLQIPAGLMPENFVPKKSKILARGNKVAKFFGEDNVSTRTVEGHLKLFDCGHFYLKQTLPGSGASPHWTIFEGRWCSTERGLKLEYLLRYSWQLSRKPYIEFAVEATRSDLVTTLAWEGETEKQLNGNLPAIVGTDDFFWAELVREGETKGASLRWNEDCPEPPSWVRKPDVVTSKPQPPPPEPQPLPEPPQSSAPREGPDLNRRRPGPDSAGQAAPTPAPRPVRESAAPERREAPAARPADPMRAPVSAGSSAGVACTEEDNESPWPLYIGFGLFIVMAAAFAYSTWEQRSVDGLDVGID